LGRADFFRNVPRTILFAGLLVVATGLAWAQTPAESPAQAEPANPPAEKSPGEAKPADQSEQQPEQKPEDKPEEKKDDSANPAAAVADKAKDVTVQAVDATKEVTKQALIKARDWETGWFTGAYVEKGRKRVAMTEAQRWDIYLQQTLTTPSAYVKRMFAAGIDQARGAPSQWQGGIGGYGERFASREGQFIAANSLAALGNAALRYEPRYDQCTCSGFWPRTRHAIWRNFVTYDRSEEHLRPQLALYGGAFGGGLVSDAWKPKPRSAFAEGGRAMAGQALYGSALNFFIEFAGDINHKIGARRKARRQK
jgi:hypothetical protein